jgi:hypothetical protein
VWLEIAELISALSGWIGGLDGIGVLNALVGLYQRPSTLDEPAGLVLGSVVTMAVATDATVVEPAELLAVTDTRIVDPTSNDARR